MTAPTSTFYDKIQTTGTYDPERDEYSFTVASGVLVTSFEFLKEADVRRMLSCLECLLNIEGHPHNEQCQADLGNTGG